MNWTDLDSLSTQMDLWLLFHCTMKKSNKSICVARLKQITPTNTLVFKCILDDNSSVLPRSGLYSEQDNT